MVTRDEVHRTMKLELDEGRAATVAEAQTLSQTYRLQIDVGEGVAQSPTRQVALLTAVNAGVRAFGGGVHVCGDLEWELAVPWGAGQRAAHVVQHLGGTPIAALSEDHPTVAIGTADRACGSIVMQATWDGWCGGVVSAGVDRLGEALEHPLAGVVAGALGVSEGFAHVRGDIVAGHRSAGLSLWHLDQDWRDPTAIGPTLEFLPTRLWLLGLGHLGQASLWALGFLPYQRPAEVVLVLQDYDHVVEANRSTGLLVQSDTPNGLLKTRMAAAAMERLGFSTRIVERLFDQQTRPAPGEPTWALAGFDNAKARGQLGAFDVAIDLGLGSSADDYLGIHVHTFPAAGDPAVSFSTRPPPVDVPPALWALDAADDQCGVVQLQGVAVGAAFVGAAAAATGLAEILRALAGQPLTAVASIALTSLNDVDLVAGDQVPHSNPGFQKAL